MNKILSGVTGLALLATASAARADVTVNFTVGSVASTSWGGSTVALNAGSGSVVFTALTGNEIDNVPIQNLVWTTGNAPVSGTSTGLALNRTIGLTLVGAGAQPSQSLYQSGHLTIVPKASKPSLQTANTIGTDAGTVTTEFNFGTYLVDVVTDSQTFNLKPNSGPKSFGLTADFILTPVPEASTMIAGAGALGLLLIGAGVHSKRSVQRIG